MYINNNDDTPYTRRAKSESPVKDYRVIIITGERPYKTIDVFTNHNNNN